MLKRLLAWGLLIGFVLMLVNFFVFRWQLGFFTMVYAIIVIWFLIFSPRVKKRESLSANSKEEDLDEPKKDSPG